MHIARLQSTCLCDSLSVSKATDQPGFLKRVSSHCHIVFMISKRIDRLHSLQRSQRSLGNPTNTPSVRPRSILDPVPPFPSLLVVSHATDPQPSVGRPPTAVYLFLLFSAFVFSGSTSDSFPERTFRTNLVCSFRSIM